MAIDQDSIFVGGEGDRWLERNKLALKSFDSKTDTPCQLVQAYRLKPQAILEAGAATGFRLEALRQITSARRVVAVDPSSKALQEGKALFPKVEYHRGTLANLDLDGPFDLVIVNFVFHWVDRGTLLKAVAEVDSVLMEGGHLIIGDFFPAGYHRVRYHHAPDQEIYTYKQDYSNVFVASGLYHTVGLITGHHSAKSAASDVEEQERVGTWLLQKRLHGHYETKSLH